MSRIYHNTTLQNKPVHNERLQRDWNTHAHNSGRGVLVEGQLMDVSRHSVTDVNDVKLRFYVLYIKPTRMHQRKFDASGNEVEPNFSNTKKVNTGFLMSSYKVEVKGQSDALSEDQLSAMVNDPELVKVTDRYRPAGTWAFWYQESDLDHMDLELGQNLRLKTRGTGPFILSLSRLDGGTVSRCNFAGDENVGASWTTKIMKNKNQDHQDHHEAEHGDAAEDHEWDD